MTALKKERYHATKVFITTPDMQLAQRLIRLLYQHGIDAFLVTEEQGEKLEQFWYPKVVPILGCIPTSIKKINCYMKTYP